MSYRGTHAHLTDDTLERFATQTLTDSESGPLMDYVLMCSD